MLRTTEGAPPISEQDVIDFETATGLRLPSDYKELLLATNGGRPERDSVPVPTCVESPMARVHFFFGINDPVRSADLAWNIETLTDTTPSGMIPIASTEGADLFFLSIENGEVFFWDGYADAWHKVASSFNEFLNSLVAELDGSS
jgi:hypothetical protein